MDPKVISKAIAGFLAAAAAVTTSLGLVVPEIFNQQLYEAIGLILANGIVTAFGVYVSPKNRQ